MSKDRRKKKLSLLFRLLFLVVSVMVLLRIVDFKLVFEHIKAIPFATLVILVVIALFRTWLTGVRWQMVNPDVTGMTSWQYFRLVMMAKPFNLIMPGALGGDFIRAALTMKEVKAKRVDNVIGIAVDRFVGLLSITILGATALAFMSDLPDKKPFYNCFAVLASAFAVGVFIGGTPLILNWIEAVFSRLGNIGRKLNHLLETWSGAMRFFRQNPHRLLGAVALCLPIHGLSFVTTYVIAGSLNIHISFFDVCAVLSLVWVITAVPVTISGAGVRELSMIYFLSLMGVEAEPATALSVYLYIITLVLGLVGLVFFAFDRSLVGKNKEALCECESDK